MFPFNQPAPTAFYLVLFIATLAVHVAFMNYVLAGSAWLAWATLRGRDSEVARVLRDWLPAAVSAAITAGVAPLLFIQILYTESFYTANLLLLHRWMAILPVLLVGFYLTYLLKVHRFPQWPAKFRWPIAVGTFLCILFVAYSWTENHLLSLEPTSYKAAFYESSSMVYRNRAILPRLALWVIGAFPTMTLLIAWQTRRTLDSTESRRLAMVALVGLALAAGALAFSPLGDAPTRHWAYLAAAVAGALLQALSWLVVYQRRRLDAAPLALASAGAGVSILAMTTLREIFRVESLDIAALYASHRASAQVGGLVVFLVFTAINAALIAWCFVLVRTPAPASAETPKQ